MHLEILDEKRKNVLNLLKEFNNYQTGEKMEFYKKMVIKVLESSESARESYLLKILKSGYDLSQKEKMELEELIDSII